MIMVRTLKVIDLLMLISENGKTVKTPSATAGKPQMRYCASHNLPYGTQIYVPDMAQMGIGDVYLQ